MERPPNTRSRLYEITDALRKSPNPEARMVVELVAGLVEEARSALVSADNDNLLRAQGEARAFERLYKQLTVNPPNTER